MSALGLVIHRFWTTYEKDKTDPAKLVEVDWVEYGPQSGYDRSRCREKVRNLAKLQPLEGASNPAIAMAHARWNEIEKHFQAWKQGREAPLDGTPLAAWNALTPEQADLFRTRGFKTVEAIAAMTDSTKSQVQIPNISDLIRQAKNFIDAAEQTRLAAKLTEKDDQISSLKAENVDRDEQIRALTRKVEELATLAAAKAEAEEEQPKKVGRHRKVEAA